MRELASQATPPSGRCVRRTESAVYQIRASDPNAVYNDAQDAYAKLRHNAHLPAGKPGMAVTTPLRWVPVTTPLEALPPPRATRRPASLPHERLLLKARTAYANRSAGQYEYAIVTAHAACEVAIARAILRLVADQAGSLQAALQGLIGNRHDLADIRVSRLWDALTGDDIRHADFWPRYSEHLVRRHGVVHEGESMSRGEAEASIEVAQDVCDHVTERSP